MSSNLTTVSNKQGIIMIKFICLVLLLIAAPSFGYDFPEKYYQEKTCTTGIIEYTNSDRTRTDCYTKTQSAEYDFANKWYECIGQSLHYAMLNQNHAVCGLMVEKESDTKYVERAEAVVNHYKLPVTIIVVR